ncbi:hypothetical protein [Campylobacter mucosalis]|uniref:hypothetical protein n=1 Tax=Campylobacter mucosalis TaxID=202 RepID=UPI0004D5B38D|nr:hypothetical protein [Campylobacter mucosalis]KEA46406.1 hypothetical protein CR66_00690 [Campylobacter mucosalis]QKF63108.1 hypothetical protein CMCT_0971 [Campylobacter mucosalis]
MQVILNNVSSEILAVLESLKALSPNLEIKKKKELPISGLDKAIDEFKKGDVIECKNFKDYQKKMRS